MTFSEYSEALDINQDGTDDALVHYRDFDGDGVAHAVSAELDTDFNGIEDTVLELDGVDEIVSVSYDIDEDGTIDMADLGNDGTVEIADLNSDRLSTSEEVSIAQSALDALAES